MNGKMQINNEIVKIEGEKNILDLVRKAGIDLPTFCYYSELSVYGACRMCMVEDEKGEIIASCSTPPKDGMKILTRTPKLQKHRRMILELLLSNHCGDCAICEKNGKCRLQELAMKMGIRKIRFKKPEEKYEIDNSSVSLVRNANKCIMCGDCVRVCEEIQGVGVIGFSHRGSKLQVAPPFGKKLSEVDCVNCGQCSAVCPTGAIVIKNNIDEAWEFISRKDTRVVVQIAPAVRVALGEEFGYSHGDIVTGKIVSALKRIGVDEVYDTCVGADLTVIEESNEFLDKVMNNTLGDMPLFTSCCPAWMKLADQKLPELKKHISTCRSPQQMFGAVIKEYYKEADALDNKKTIMISVMPCTAKKYEASKEEYSTLGNPDVDLVITTQELAKMMTESGIVFDDLQLESLDMPFGLASGAGVIFGASGGVAEAVVRRCLQEKTSVLKIVEFMDVEGLEGVKETSITINNQVINIAVVSGLGNAQRLVKEIQKGNRKYHFVEVMACIGGCISGAGQPFTMDTTIKDTRRKAIYKADRLSQIKKSQDNPVIENLYNNLLKQNRHILHNHK